MKMPSGLKNKTVILHATTTTKVRNRPHQKTITYPHAVPPPKMPQKYTELLGGGEGVITLPLPHGDPKKVMVKEPLLFSHRKMYKHTKKERHI